MTSNRSRLPVVLIIVFGGLLLLIGGVLAWQVGRPGSGAAAVTSPRLGVDRDEIDFGQVAFNKKVKATFKVSNEGGKPLQIVGEPRVEVAKGC